MVAKDAPKLPKSEDKPNKLEAPIIKPSNSLLAIRAATKSLSYSLHSTETPGIPPKIISLILSREEELAHLLLPGDHKDKDGVVVPDHAVIRATAKIEPENIDVSHWSGTTCVVTWHATARYPRGGKPVNFGEKGYKLVSGGKKGKDGHDGKDGKGKGEGDKEGDKVDDSNDGESENSDELVDEEEVMITDLPPVVAVIGVLSSSSIWIGLLSNDLGGKYPLIPESYPGVRCTRELW